MYLLESDGGVVCLKYEEPGYATMIMCYSARVFLWYLLSTPRTCVKVLSILLEFITTFPAFSADLALIDHFRSVDRRQEIKIMLN